MRATLVRIVDSLTLDCVVNVSGSMGKQGQEHRTYKVSLKCKVTLNGAAAMLSDLRSGDVLELDGKPAVKITATRRT